MKDILKGKRDMVLKLAHLHGAKNIRLFGSAARGDTHPGSDIDLLVDMEEGKNYLDLIGFWQDLEDLFGCHVDVITDGGMSPYLRDRIYSEARPI